MESHLWPKTAKIQLKLARKHLDDPQGSWENILWAYEAKTFLKFASLYIWRKHSTSEQKSDWWKWKCPTVSGPGHVAVVDGTINPVEVQFGVSVGAAGRRSKIHQSPPLNGSNKSGLKSDWDEFKPSVQVQKRKPNKKSGRAWHCGFRAFSSETTWC